MSVKSDQLVLAEKATRYLVMVWYVGSKKCLYVRSALQLCAFEWIAPTSSLNLRFSILFRKLASLPSIFSEKYYSPQA
jgi:hypothetical protein